MIWVSGARSGPRLRCDASAGSKEGVEGKLGTFATTRYARMLGKLCGRAPALEPGVRERLRSVEINRVVCYALQKLVSHSDLCKRSTQ